MNKSVFSMLFLLQSSFVLSAVDPTRPPGQQSYTQNNDVGTKKIVLQGLVVGEQSWVVINDLVIKEGQKKKGIGVLKIEPTKVLVKINGDKFWLKWQTEVIKKHLNAESIK